MPKSATAPMSWIKPLALPLDEDPRKGWRPFPIFRGRTATTVDFSCHVSVLSPGKSPHPPHRHPEEELLIVLAGTPELVIAADGGERIQPLAAGSGVYYPAGQGHTIRNPGATAATYLMFKWRNAPGTSPADRHLPTTLIQGTEWPTGPAWKGRASSKVFEGPTRFLHRLHCHRCTLPAGSGYPPHADPYDVAIVLLSGEVETLGQRAGAGSVIWYASGEPHGLRNIGSSPARYLVFEFHGTPAGRSIQHLRERLLQLPRRLLKGLAAAGRGKLRR